MSEETQTEETHGEELSAQAQLALETLERMLEEMDFPEEVDIEVEETEEEIALSMHSDKPLTQLIGKGGNTLNALEVLIGQITRHKLESYGKRITVDAEGYRAGQTERLAEQGREAARQALEGGEAVDMAPMNARDRRIVHMAIAEIEGVETYSKGEDPYRRVVVCPAGQVPAEDEDQETGD